MHTAIQAFALASIFIALGKFWLPSVKWLFPAVQSSPQLCKGVQSSIAVYTIAFEARGVLRHLSQKGMNACKVRARCKNYLEPDTCLVAAKLEHVSFLFRCDISLWKLSVCGICRQCSLFQWALISDELQAILPLERACCASAASTTTSICLMED